MWPESSEEPKPLRSGLTTGTCATACCVAASRALLTGKKTTEVEVTLPKGKIVTLKIEQYESLGENSVRTSTIKDAGDDPDVTHGATVFVELEKVPAVGVRFYAAQGVGTVTLEGLVLAVGDAAINPMPRKMMTQHLENIAKVYAYDGGFNVAVGVVNGENIAKKTMNPRLGIVGGLSILGTTGIVRPYSCAAYIASIHQGIDVAHRNGIVHLAASTGSTSEASIQAHYNLQEMALIEMGDFVGAVLKHLRKVPIARVSLCLGFGKATKLANGHMDLNSRVSNIDFKALASLAARAGASEQLQADICSANTSMQVLSYCTAKGIDLGNLVCEEALKQARKALLRVPINQLNLEVWAVDRQGKFIGHAYEKSFGEG